VVVSVLALSATEAPHRDGRGGAGHRRQAHPFAAERRPTGAAEHPGCDFTVPGSPYQRSIGLAAEKQAPTFGACAQADQRTTRCLGRTGLGLSIARELVPLSGGRLRASGC